MTYQPVDFQRQLILIGLKNRTYPTLVTELQTIGAALNTDTTTHDVTVALPPAAVKPGPGKTAFSNEALLLVNRGKGGNLANTVMSGIINGALGLISPPVNTAAPALQYVSGGGGAGTVGAQYLCTNGTWSPAATSFTRQWLRNGAAITGATAASYTTVTADGGTNLSCALTAYNAAGEATVTTAAVAIAAP